jgi:hypothetical protein
MTLSNAAVGGGGGTAAWDPVAEASRRVVPGAAAIGLTEAVREKIRLAIANAVLATASAASPP